MAASGERGDGVCGLTTLSGSHIDASPLEAFHHPKFSGMSLSNAETPPQAATPFNETTPLPAVPVQHLFQRLASGGLESGS
jgi:hypothetical protein